MEQLTTQLLEDWTSDTKKVLTGALRDCRFSQPNKASNLRFPNLNGSAPVCYGFPVTVKHALQLKPGGGFDTFDSADGLASKMSGLQISKSKRTSPSKQTITSNESKDEIMTDVKTTNKEEKKVEKKTTTTTTMSKDEKKTATSTTVSRTESAKSIRALEEKKPAVPKLIAESKTTTTATGSENASVNTTTTTVPSKTSKPTTSTSTRTKSSNSVSTLASEKPKEIIVILDDENLTNTTPPSTKTTKSTTTTTTSKVLKETKQEIAVGKEPTNSTTTALTDSKRATRSSTRTKK